MKISLEKKWTAGTGRRWLVAAVCSLLLTFAPSPASGVSLGFAEQSAISGEVILDVLVSGLGEGIAPTLGAFDIDVDFNSAAVSLTDVTFGAFLGDLSLFEAIGDAQLISGGVNLVEVSFLPPVALDALQPASFPLATLSFDRISSQNSGFSFGRVHLTDAQGDSIPLVPLDEPGMLAIFCAAVAALVFLHRATPRTRPLQRM